jgi:transposase
MVARDQFPIGQSYSITIMTNLFAANGFHISQPRTTSNTAFDFLLFLIELLRDGHLVTGDTLVLDNASIHYTDDIGPVIDSLMTGFGCRLLFLPTYSPELNPCELVFAQLKRWIRTNRTANHLLHDVALACTSVTRHSVLRYYDKCINNFFR